VSSEALEQQKDRPDALPLPRVDLLKANHYMFRSMQISRGARSPARVLRHHRHLRPKARLKTSQQVWPSRSFRRAGLNIIFVVDDNLIGNKKAIANPA
jgi:hypothetical protein